jgi:CheY-like chemotaxis protein
VRLADVLQRTVDGARASMDERGHALALALPTEAIQVEADAARLEQAIANLLTNAAKYTDPGGTISVAAEREGDDAVIRVRDNGIGIAPDVLPRVFDLFAQGARSLDRAQGGLGIGLTLVRRIVELHGGTVDASSAGIGRGAEFVIRLRALPPAADGTAVPPPEDARPAVAAHHPARVLMVEDNPDAAETLVMILELLGHHVRVVHDGLAALDAARANVPDIMLVDIGLPGIDGYEVAQRIRRDAALKHIVLVALTGYGRPEDKELAIAAGFDYHLVKPVDVDALGALVAKLGGSAGRRPSGDDPGTVH